MYEEIKTIIERTVKNLHQETQATITHIEECNGVVSVYINMPENLYFIRASRMLIIEGITNAVDKVYRVYTDIHLTPRLESE